MGKMRINVSNMPVKEFEMLVCMLQLCGWWIEISARDEAVWIQMDKPVVDVPITDSNTLIVR